MNTKQMECFLTAADDLSFTKAAEKLYMSQSTLSRNISLMEEEIGVALFVRDKRQQTQLTPAGALLYRNFKGIYKNLTDAISQAKRISEGFFSTLKIGMLDGLMIDAELKKYFADFSAQYPGIELSYGRYGYLLEELEQGNIDICISILDTLGRSSDFAFELLYARPTLLVMHKSFLKEKKEIYSLLDFKDAYFIKNMQKGFSVFNDRMLSLCRESGFEPKCLEAPDIQVQSLWVEMGLGVAGFTQNKSVINGEDMIAVHVKEYSPVTFGAIWKKDNQNPAIPLFVEFLRSHKNA